MEAHCHSDCNYLASYGPNFFAVIFVQCQEMATAQKNLHQFKGVRP